ncbi:MAG TPA: DUF4923 domain-containing protein [Porphyromonadaceae bacterium]|nr:DUF4923 domain-containing protein [Porphyromonadaceae bacterium]
MFTKKQLLLVCLLGMTCLDVAQGISFGDVLSSSTLKKVAKDVIGENTTISNITGTWKYVKPAIKLTSENVLTNVGGSVASSTLESKVEETCKKVGISSGTFSFVFNEDNTFSVKVKGQNLPGSYTFNSEEKQVNLSFSSSVQKLYKGFSLTANVEKSSSTNLTLLFDADKFLELLKAVSSATSTLSSSSSSLSALSAMIKEYNGLKIGFETTKE